MSMQMQRRVGGYVSNPFATLALEGGQWPTPCFGRCTPWKDPGTHCAGGWVGPAAGLNVAENLVLTGIRSPYSPAYSDSLYRLRYAGRQEQEVFLDRQAGRQADR
jgi:hypothetical protein